MNEPQEYSDAEVARLGLLLDEDRATVGLCPELDELWNWMHGDCEPEREAEILSHLAADEDLYELWRSLRVELANLVTADGQVTSIDGMKEDQVATTVASSKINPWLRDWSNGAFAYAAMLALVVVNLGVFRSQVDQDTPVWENWRVPKAVAQGKLSEETEIELQPVLVGIHAALESLEHDPVGPDGRTLPDALRQCKSSYRQCQTRRQHMFTLGKLATLTLNRCQNNLTVAVPLELDSIERTLDRSDVLGIMRAPVARWNSADHGDTSTICAAASLVLDRALTSLE